VGGKEKGNSRLKGNWETYDQGGSSLGRQCKELANGLSGRLAVGGNRRNGVSTVLRLGLGLWGTSLDGQATHHVVDIVDLVNFVRAVAGKLMSSKWLK
jgi:hypothetical protein